MQHFPLSAVLILVALVVVEVAVLVSVIVTQRAHDRNASTKTLQELTDSYTVRVQSAIATFMYNVVRAAAAAPKTGFFSQKGLEEALQLADDPRITPATLYFWTPKVPLADAAAYAQFYGFNLTHLKNGSASVVVPYEPGETSAFGGDVAVPYTIFVPPLPADSDPRIFGFDLLSLASSAPSFRNNTSKYLLVPSGLVERSINNYGVIAVANNQHNRGYILGRIGSKDLLEFVLVVPRRYVTLAAFVLSATGARQALFFDLTPLLGNVTTVALFDQSPGRPSFFTSTFSSFNETIMVAVRYDEAYAAEYKSNTWVILAAVLAPVCFLIDVIWVILVLLWQRKKMLHEMEQIKRKEAQVMICYVNHGEWLHCWLGVVAYLLRRLEIRNPLQTILGLADLHMDEAEEEGDAALASDLGTIVRAAEFIEHIARDILDVRRVEDGKLDVQFSDVDLSVLLNGLQKAVLPLQLKNAGVVFKIVRDPEMVTVRTDRYRLEQILLNFLTNAYKHTVDGSVTLSLSFVSMAWVRFSVIDTGSGISPEMQQKLFLRFSQSSARDAADLGGFGLGLYLTKKLAELLGGHVGFESTSGVGSAFWVELPAGRSDMSVSIQFEQTETRLPPANDFN